MVMRGEECFAAELARVVDVLDDGPSNRESVEGACSAADFVEYDEAARGGVGKDVGGFEHLDHEGALAGGNIVLGADTGEYPVDDADGGLVGGDERADLGHERYESDLPQPAAFAGHVGSGEDDYLV